VNGLDGSSSPARHARSARLRNTSKIAQVMKNGRLYDAATLNETYPRQKALGAQC
jgi:hypothetical protein